MAGDDNNGQFKIDMAEFRGFTKAAIEAIEKTTDVKLDAFGQLFQRQLDVIKADQEKNYDCMCEMRDTVAEVKEKLAVSAAVRKVKDGLWGALGGGTMTIAVMLAKDFLKSKFFGGGQ